MISWLIWDVVLILMLPPLLFPPLIFPCFEGLHDSHRINHPFKTFRRDRPTADYYLFFKTLMWTVYGVALWGHYRSIPSSEINVKAVTNENLNKDTSRGNCKLLSKMYEHLAVVQPPTILLTMVMLPTCHWIQSNIWTLWRSARVPSLYATQGLSISVVTANKGK